MSRIYKTWEEIKKAIKLGQRVRVGYYSDGFLDFRSQLGSITEISDNQFIINNSHGFTCGVKALEVEIIDNSDVTNKTWDNLEEKDILENSEGLQREVLGVCGRMVFTTMQDSDDSGSCEWTKQELINYGYKIKGASEEKPSIDDVIEEMEGISGFLDITSKDRLRVAIEMLKKLKS